MRRLFITALLVTMAGCGSSRSSGEAAPTTVARVATTTAVAPTTTVTTLPPTTTTSTSTPAAVIDNPVPVPPEGVTEPLQPIGEIAIARLGIDDTLYEGVTLGTLDNGPGHWPGSALPGEPGNVVVAGHRVSHTRPFRYLDRMQEGDEVVFTVSGRRSVYVVTSSEIVTPERTDIIDPTPAPTATLFACHPPGSTRFRYVVHLALSANA